MDVLIGILLLSVLANMALLAWISRSDHVTLHWPRRLQPIFESMRPRKPADEIPTVCRRPVYAAEPQAPRAATAPAAAYMPASASAPIAAAMPSRSPHAETLPRDLAELLKPASIAPNAGGFGYAPARDGSGRPGGLPVESGGDGGSILACLPQGPVGRGGMTVTGLGIDPLTGLEGPLGWSRIVEIENARLLRYRRPVTVVMVEIEGLRRLVDRLGEEPLERLLPVIADAFRREARASDWVARIGEGRFAAFLPETDEIQAINYVERIRIVCEPWLASAAVPLRLAIGWSSPTASSDLEFALRRAEERMHSDRRMPGKSLQPPRMVPARVVSLPPRSREEEAAEALPATTDSREPVAARVRGHHKPRAGAGAEASSED